MDVLDIRDFLKEIAGALTLRFDCTQISFILGHIIEDVKKSKFYYQKVLV
jgi:hypothetical protein